MAADNLTIGGDVGLALAMFLAIGAIYASWFRRPRSAYGFIWLLWFTLGLAATPFSTALGMPIAHNLAEVVHAWLPWNLLLLMVLPTARVHSMATAAIVVLLSLQLIIPLLVPIETWQQLPGLNEQLVSALPAAAQGILAPIEPLLLVIAALGFFLRWQISGRMAELALSIGCTLLLFGFLRPEFLLASTAAAGAVLFVLIIYTSRQMAFVDALTGLPNRRSFDHAISSLPRRYAVAMLDIDHFKRINDRFGHDVGDQVLRMTAARLRRLRHCRTYRYGGEEFALLFRGSRADAAADICELARATIAEQPMALRSRVRPPVKPISKARYRRKVPGMKITVSVGLASSTPDDDAQAVVQAADKALYRAKRNGRNRTVIAGKRGGS